jgi:hypothetical protein
MRRDTSTSLQASTKLNVSATLQQDHVTEVLPQVLANLAVTFKSIKLMPTYSINDPQPLLHILSSAFLINLQYHVRYQQHHRSQNKPHDSTQVFFPIPVFPLDCQQPKSNIVMNEGYHY